MLKLVIGNKNYSSWSMRPWLALRGNDIPFEEVFIPLYTDDKADKDRILSFSRAGKVPALIDGDVTVWDSLSIIEYLAEKFPQAKLWPEDRARRAHSRSISAEMHSGFMPLRNECGMNLHRPVGAIDLSVADLIDVCLEENERRLSGYDGRLLRPNLVPRLMRFARRFVRRPNPAAAPS